MTEPKEPQREFWVELNPEFIGPYNTKIKKYDCYNTLMLQKVVPQLHVIEFSAYQALQAELEKVKALFVDKEISDGQMFNIANKNEIIKRLESELATEKARAQRLVNCLESIIQIDLDTWKRHPEYEGEWSHYSDLATKALAEHKDGK
jgi:hypothetical protein